MRIVVRRVLLVVTVLWAVLLSVAVLVYVLPLVPWQPWLLVSLLINPYGPYLVLAAVFGVLLAVLAGRHGARHSAVGSGLASAICVVLAVVPIAAVLGAAESRGVTISPWDYSAVKDNETFPDSRRSTTYATVDGQQLRLDVWQPQGEGSHPAVVWVHGGGFATGQRGEAAKWYQWLNQRGFAVFSIDYRLTPPARWRQAPGDVKCAVGWVRSNAERLHVDPNRLVLAGGSAGGNLALVAAYSAGDDRLPPSCPARDTSVRAVLALYPGTDPTDLSGSLTENAGDSLAYTGGDPNAEPLVKPMTFVSPTSPPTYLAAGTHDVVVRYEQSLKLDRVLTSSGVPHTLVGIPYADHIFDFRWGTYASQLARATMGEFLDSVPGLRR
ncbi:alpha/beta hydrolase [Kutzneria albida]|uniref:alpha/beta hydrolase n=1 Tax=Kutzneria albida TaxID=43357 RepID=UPI0004BBE7F3|nr:alpha/beta hydrolase [Kutzneria albida]